MNQEIEVIRMVTAVAKDVALGVNAQIALLPLDAGDTAPLALTIILSEFDDDIEVREKPATGWPIGLILIDPQGSTAEPEAEVGYRDGDVPVVFCYVSEGPVLGKDRLDAKNACQAFVNSMKRGLLASNKIGTAGLKNGVQILQATSLSTPKVESEFEIGTVVGAVRMSFNVRNNVV
jgi:hypothetical protein